VAITPNPEQFAELTAAPDTGPVVMINLLKFKAEEGGSSGAEAYARYGVRAAEMVAERGGRLLWAGRVEQVLIGDPQEDWDLAVLVEYPSRKTFIEMVTSPEYLEAHAEREAGLGRTVLLACSPLSTSEILPGPGG
jgi:uncharacterized protein (DUF1330 family)